MPPRVPARPWAALCLASWLAMACGEAPEPPPPDNALHELDLRDLPPEISPPTFLSGVERPSFRQVLADIHRLAQDDRSRGLFVRLGPLQGAWGVQHDLGHALGTYRSSGKPVHCHFTDLDNAGFALAARGCDRLTMTPAGTLNLVGLVLQLVNMRELLDSLGVQAELHQVGKYKGAAEPFTRSEPSDELMQNLTSLLGQLDRLFQRAIAERTGDGGDPLAQGPYSAQEATAAKLLDAVEYADTARSEAKTAAGAKNHVLLHDPPEPEPLDLSTLWKAITRDPEEDEPQGPRLGYVVLEGEIIDGQNVALGRIVAEPAIEALNRFAENDDIKAVVLRIDSPGGSALASDRIWHAVRRLAEAKPVAISIGDMAASGGYYVACAGTRVFTAPGSLVGSIGVVGGKVNLSELASENGVHVTELARGPNAAWLSPLTPFSESQREELQALLERTYRLFLRRVADGRGLSDAALEKVAQGRIMSGAQAVDGGLADATGGLHEAVAWAREQGGLAADAPIETWPGEEDALAALTNLLTQVRGPSTLEHLEQAIRDRTDLRLPTWLLQLGQGDPAATVLPVQLRIR